MPVGQVKMKRYKNASELYDVFYKERKEDIAFYSRLLTEYKSRLDNNRVIEIGCRHRAGSAADCREAS